MAEAARWKVDPASCSADRGEVVHRPSDRRVAYGSLVSEAAKQPVPNDPALKNASGFKIIGQPTARIDGPDIVCGKAQYGIDVKIPGMLYASLERPPFTGGKVKQMQEDKARAVHGVHSIITLPRGIAVIADNTWAAIKGRATLAVEWEDAPQDAFDSDAHWERLETASRETGFSTREEKAPPGTADVKRRSRRRINILFTRTHRSKR